MILGIMVAVAINKKANLMHLNNLKIRILDRAQRLSPAFLSRYFGSLRRTI
jgi:hypothetical protein